MKPHRFVEHMQQVDPVARRGQVQRVLPTSIEASGPNLPIGALCYVEAHCGSHMQQRRPMMAEVVKVDRTHITLVPLDSGLSTFSGARVEALEASAAVHVDDGYLGRAIDALGRPMDGLASIRATAQRPLQPASVAPLSRTSQTSRLPTGIRAIDTLLTLGVGQRIGIFAASGVGKTSLITQLANQMAADCVVVCLVGERGREAEALWSQQLGPDVRARTTLITATSDDAAAMRVRSAYAAMAHAEYHRDQGRHVLFILDSVSRLAMALRELGLAAGEPPTVRAYTPSVFAALPRFIERCGALKSGGAITGVMTILCETDDIEDPIAEILKSLLDGHIILARTLAEQGHYPAIDVPRSISRQAQQYMDDTHKKLAQRAIAQLARYEESKTLIQAGLYVGGSDTALDEALEKRANLLDFLKQAANRSVPFDQSVENLRDVLGSGA